MLDVIFSDDGDKKGKKGKKGKGKDEEEKKAEMVTFGQYVSQMNHH